VIVLVSAKIYKRDRFEGVFLAKVHNTENSKQIFPERKWAVTVPISTYIIIYIFPGSVCLFCCRKICESIPAIYKLLTDT
jgi:hypothetical protein